MPETNTACDCRPCPDCDGEGYHAPTQRMYAPPTDHDREDYPNCETCGGSGKDTEGREIHQKEEVLA